MRFSLVPRQAPNSPRSVHNASTAAHPRPVPPCGERRFQSIPDRTVGQEAVTDLEHKGDDITAEIIGLLNTQYVTPLDREDIYALASAIDTVVDYLDDASELIDVYHIESPMEQAVEQCRILVGSTVHLANALNGLRGLRTLAVRLRPKAP